MIDQSKSNEETINKKNKIQINNFEIDKCI